MFTLNNAVFLADLDFTTTGISWPPESQSWRLGQRADIFRDVAEQWARFGHSIIVSGRPAHVVEDLLDQTPFVDIGIAESGAVSVVKERTPIVLPNPSYEVYRKTQRQLVINAIDRMIQREHLQYRVKQVGSFISAICYYCEEPYKSVGSEFNFLAEFALRKEGLRDLVDLSFGEALDIFPAKNEERPKLDKAAGVKLIPQLYESVYHSEFPNSIVAAGDSKADIPMFDEVKRIATGGYKFITVANANSYVKEYVRKNGGIVSEQPFALGVKEAILTLSEMEFPSGRERDR